MTSSTGSRTDSAFPTEQDVAALRRRMLRHEQIVDGALPSTEELLQGLPLCRDDLQSDVMAYFDKWRAERKGEIDVDLVAAFELARAKADIETITALRDLCLTSSAWIDGMLAQRAEIWLAYFGDYDAKTRTIERAISVIGGLRKSSVTAAYHLVFAAGITIRQHTEEYSFGDADEVVRCGLARLEYLVPAIQSLATTVDRAGKSGGIKALISARRPSGDCSLDDDTEADLAAMDALLSDGKEDDEEETGGVVVVPLMPPGTTGQKELRKSWKTLAGKALPLVGRGDVGRHRRELVARWPHAEDAIDIILADLAVREEIRFRPTLLVGSPGSGKSSLARAIFDEVGLPCELTSLAGLSDGSVMGTSAQWATARESVPLQLIKRHGVATVGMIWDEIEKAGSSRHNGNALGALLPLLEVDQARRFRDPALEVEVDMSAVSHFATANSLEGVPAPVKDRFRIIQMPEPDWRHIGPLTRQIVDRIAVERGVDGRWFSPLAEDELVLVRSAWPGGSIRKLTAIVRTILDGRDQIMGRC